MNCDRRLTGQVIPQEPSQGEFGIGHARQRPLIYMSMTPGPGQLRTKGLYGCRLMTGTAIVCPLDARTRVALERLAVRAEDQQGSVTVRSEKGSREPHQLATSFFGMMIRLHRPSDLGHRPGSWGRRLKITSVYIVQPRVGSWLSHMKRGQDTVGHIARAG